MPKRKSSRHVQASSSNDIHAPAFFTLPEQHDDLYAAVLNKNFRAVEIIIQQIKREQLPVQTLSVMNGSGNTPLHAACHLGAFDIVQLLVHINIIEFWNEIRTTINQANQSGQYPLDLATTYFILNNNDYAVKNVHNTRKINNICSSITKLVERSGAEVGNQSIQQILTLPEAHPVRQFMHSWLHAESNSADNAETGSSSEPVNPKPARVQKRKVKYEPVLTLNDPARVAARPPLEKFLTLFWKKSGGFLQNEQYQQAPWFDAGVRTDALYAMINNELKHHIETHYHPDSDIFNAQYVEAEVDKALASSIKKPSIETREVGQLSQHLLYFLDNELSCQGNVLARFMQRASRGIVDIGTILDVTGAWSKPDQIELVQCLAQFQTYAMARGTFNSTTNYILQPLTNLLESVFNCHILGCDHQSKIPALINSLKHAQTILNKPDLSNPATNNLSSLLTCLIDLLNSLNEFPTASQRTPILNRLEENKHNLSALLDRFERIILKEFGSSEHFQHALDHFFPTPEQFQHRDMTYIPRALIEFYHNRTNPPDVTDHTTETTSLQEVIQQRVARVQFRGNFAEFQPSLPNALVAPVQKNQLTLFMLLHSAQVEDRLSLIDLCRSIGAPQSNSRVLAVSSKITLQNRQLLQEAPTDELPRLVNNIHSAQQLSFREQFVSPDNTGLPLALLPNFYTSLYSDTLNGLPINPGLGFLLVLVDEQTGQNIGFFTRQRFAGDPVTHCAAYGGHANANSSIIDCIDEFEASNRQFFPSAEAAKTLSQLSQEIKNSLSHGQSAASIVFKYSAPTSENTVPKYAPYCFLTVRVYIRVKSLEQAKEIYAPVLAKPEANSDTLPWKIKPYAHLNFYTKKRSDKNKHAPDVSEQPDIPVHKKKRAVGRAGLRPFLLFHHPKEEVNPTPGSSSDHGLHG